MGTLHFEIVLGLASGRLDIARVDRIACRSRVSMKKALEYKGGGREGTSNQHPTELGSKSTTPRKCDNHLNSLREDFSICAYLLPLLSKPLGSLPPSTPAHGQEMDLMNGTPLNVSAKMLPCCVFVSDARPGASGKPRYWGYGASAKEVQGYSPSSRNYSNWHRHLNIDTSSSACKRLTQLDYN